MINIVRFLLLLYLVIASYVETSGGHLNIQEVSGEYEKFMQFPNLKSNLHMQLHATCKHSRSFCIEN